MLSFFQSVACSSAAGYFQYRTTSVLFQLLFEYEFISKIDRKCFLPWMSTPANTPKLGKLMLTDFDHMYFVRVVPRRDLYKHCRPEHLSALWFFVKQHMTSRKRAVIPSME
jgi:dimethyladenosine transferase 2